MYNVLVRPCLSAIHVILFLQDLIPKKPTEINVNAPEKLMRYLGYILREEFLASQND